MNATDFNEITIPSFLLYTAQIFKQTILQTVSFKFMILLHPLHPFYYIHSSNRYLRLWINQIKVSPANSFSTNSQEDSAAGQTFRQKYCDTNEAQGITAICFWKQLSEGYYSDLYKIQIHSLFYMCQRRLAKYKLAKAIYSFSLFAYFFPPQSFNSLIRCTGRMLSLEGKRKIWIWPSGSIILVLIKD